MKPAGISLRIIIPVILVLASLLFISAAYLQINYNLKKEVVKTSLHHVQQIMESVQRSINNALSENHWEKAETELLAITYDVSIEKLYLVSNSRKIILSNHLSLKNKQYSDDQLQLFFKAGAMKPFLNNINDEEIIAIYPITSPLKSGEFRSRVLGALYLKYSLNHIMTQYQSVFQRNIWLLFIIMALTLLGVTIALNVLVVNPIEFLSRSIRCERDLSKPVIIDPKGVGEIAILAKEFNIREQLIRQQFEQIREKEILLQRAQEVTHVGISKRELHSNKMIWSEELYRILGRTQDIIAATYDAFEACIHPADRDSYSSTIRQLISKPSAYQIEYRIIHPDNSIRFIREQGEILEIAEKNQLNLVSVVQDITDQEQAKNFIEISPAVLFRWKAEENWPVDFVTQNISQFGYTRKEFISGQIKFNNIIHPDDREQVAQEVIQYTQENTDHFTQEYRIITHEGKVRWVDDRTTIERSASGEVLYYTGIMIDITHTKQIESEHEALGKIVRDSLNEIYIFDKDSLQFTYINRAAEKNIGYTLDEMARMTPIDIEPEISAEQFLSLIQPLEENSEKEIVYETTHRRKDGSEYFIEVHFQLMNYQERQQYIAILLDLSQRK